MVAKMHKDKEITLEQSWGVKIKQSDESSPAFYLVLPFVL